MSLRQKLFFCWSLSWLSCFKHMLPNSNVCGQQFTPPVLREYSAGKPWSTLRLLGSPPRKSMYLQLEIFFFDTSMMDSMNLKADIYSLFLQESRFNENTLKQNVKETCWVLEHPSAFDPSWIWNFSAHHESSFWGSAWFGSNLLHLHGCSWNSIWPWSHSRHGKSMVFSSWQRLQFPKTSSFFFWKFGVLQDVALLIFLGGSRNGW